jgi:hypothetical protein
MGYSLSTDTSFIEYALVKRKESFHLLVDQMKNFKPLPESHFEEEWNSKRHLNPYFSDDQWKKMVKKNTEFAAKYDKQFSFKFSDRFLSEYIQIVLLSHSLCEALINTILTVGLSNKDMEDMIDTVDRFDVKEKWTVCPKLFEPSYNLPKGKKPYQTLKKLCDVRNSYAHPKVNLTSEDRNKVVNKRKTNTRRTFDELILETNEFLKLPYELSRFALDNLQEVGFVALIIEGRSMVGNLE